MVTIPPIKMVMTGGWFIIVLPHYGLTWGVWFNPPEMDRYGDRNFSVNGISMSMDWLKQKSIRTPWFLPSNVEFPLLSCIRENQVGDNMVFQWNCCRFSIGSQSVFVNISRFSTDPHIDLFLAYEAEIIIFRPAF
jgi:hypothetical protein